MDMYSAPQIAHLMDRHQAAANRRARNARRLRLMLICLASLLVMAALCYVGPAGAAYDPAPGAAPIALSPDMDLYTAPAKLERHADYEVRGNIVERCERRPISRGMLIISVFFACLIGSVFGRYVGNSPYDAS